MMDERLRLLGFVPIVMLLGGILTGQLFFYRIAMYTFLMWLAWRYFKTGKVGLIFWEYESGKGFSRVVKATPVQQTEKYSDYLQKIMNQGPPKGRFNQ